MFLHHVAAVTRHPDDVAEFLCDVVGLEGPRHPIAVPADAAQELLGWHGATDETNGLIVGDGTTGRIELIGIPGALQDEVRPGFPLISLAVRDVEGVAEESRRQGLAVRGPRRVVAPGVDLSAVVVAVGGLTFELVRFEG